MSFPYLDETKELTDVARREAGGSFVALSNGVTHYELGGNPNGNPVVLIHGFSTPYFIFDVTYDFLVRQGFRVLRYDLFGRGYSDRPKTNYDIHLFITQLKNLVDALELKDISLLGLSMGGPISASFIDLHPNYVCKHILIDPVGARQVALSNLLEMVKLPVIGELALGLFGSASMVKGIAKDLYDPKLVDYFQKQFMIQMQYKGFKRAILSTMRNQMLDSFYETYVRVGKMKKPTLLLWGKQDNTSLFEDSALILNALPHAEFHAIEQCGHIPHFEKPGIVNPILSEFLSR
jgi:pimeloyl-ACP methyl ester carboxylesterase